MWHIYLKAAGFRCRAQVPLFFIDTARKLYDACKLSELTVPAFDICFASSSFTSLENDMLFTSQCILSYVAMLYLKSIVITAAKPLVQLVCKRYRAVLASGAAYRYNKLVLPSEI